MMPDLTELQGLSAVEAAAAIADGRISSEELVRACLERIEATDASIRAWTHLDPDHALAQARQADERRRRGKPIGPLHGVPVGLKDIIDTEDYPTEDGTPLHHGRRPPRDASLVAFLRRAGAVILGKTATTEFAFMHPATTRNPHNPEHSPGGSSSGSAAAVAAAQVPLAVGSQTNGSVIRPASFCGVYGFKPTFGAIPRTGMLRTSRHLDHAGVFARSLADAAAIAEAIMDHDGVDPDGRFEWRPPLRRLVAEEPPVRPRLAFVRTPVWDQADDDVKQGFAELVEALGGDVVEVELPTTFQQAHGIHRLIMAGDFATHLGKEYQRGAEKMSSELREFIEEGQRVLAMDYNQALERRSILAQQIDEVFDDFDAILTPSAPGEAPRGLDTTGNPTFCTIWTLCGTPAVTLPLLEGDQGLPVGVQLVGRRGEDARLLQVAAWLEKRLAEAV